ncbi:MAG: hypothetical protein EOM66_09990 [Clostridia bacterium]|nr:hypothetical protein [Clostridia bacterium]
MPNKKYIENITVRLTANEANYLRQVTDDNMTPISKVVRHLIRGYLQKEIARRRLLRPVGT